MAKCQRCGNELVSRPYKKQVYKGMGVYRNKTYYESICEYCIWKGDSGPGKQLKQLIKEADNDN